MSYRVRATGRLIIDPPLSYTEIRNRPWRTAFLSGDKAGGIRAVRVVTSETLVETDDGPLTKTTGTEVELYDDNCRGFEEDLQELVDSFPGHRWVGEIDAQGEEATDMFRVYVRGGKVVVVRPEIVWPDAPADDPVPTVFMGSY